MATSDAVFTVTRNEDGSYSISPSSQEVLVGGTVTLVAAGQDTYQLVGKLSSDNTSYEPLGPAPYDAVPSPGKPYTLETLDTGYLEVLDAATSPTGTIVPVVAMRLTGTEFVPGSVDVSQGGLLQLTWTGAGTEATIRTYAPDGQPFALFGGTGNEYVVSSNGSLFTIPTDTTVADGYYIEFESSTRGGPIVTVPVRGTVNVRRRK